VHPQSLPSFFRSSLEAPLLSSILSVFRDVLQEHPEVTTAVREYMTNFPRVQRFKTVTLFMDKAEKKLVDDIWGLIGGNDEDRASWGLK
jgi:RNA polymerase II-associated protein 3